MFEWFIRRAGETWIVDGNRFLIFRLTGDSDGRFTVF